MIRAGSTSAWTGAFLSVLAGVIASLVDAAIARIVGGFPPFAMASLAVVGVAVLGSATQSLLTAVASFAVALCFFAYRTPSLADGSQAFVFVGVSLGAAVLARTVRRAAKAAREAETKLEQVEGVTLRVLDHATEALAVFDPSGKFVFANRAAANAVGRSAEDLTGRCIDEVYPPLAGSAQFQMALSGDSGLSTGYETRDPRTGRWFLIRAARTEEGIAASATDITEVKQAGEQLRLQLGEVQNLYRLAPAALCAVDLELRFIRINDAFAELGGRSASDLLGRQVREALPNVADALEPLLFEVIESGRAMANVELAVARTGTAYPRIVIASFEPLRGADDAVVGVNAAVQDITDRKRVETVAAESNQRLRIALDAARMGTWEFDLVAGQVTYGPNETQLLSLPNTGRATIREYLDRIHPDFRQGLMSGILARTPEQPMFEAEFRVVLPNGEDRWVRNVGRVEFDRQGKPVAAVGVSIDFTERQRDAEEIELANRQLQAVIDASPLAIVLMRPDGTVGLWNERATAVLGRTREQANDDLESGDQDADSLAYFLTKYAGRDALGEEHLCRKRTGERLILSVFARPIPLGDRQVLGTVIVVVDVTERRLSEDRLRVLNEASMTLSESLAYESTLDKVARLVVPRFADWCAIDLVRGMDLERLAVAHIDPGKVELVRRLRERYPDDPNRQSLVRRVVETGRPVMLPEVTAEMIRSGTVDDAHRQMIESLGFTAAIVTPLVSRGRVYGTMTFVWAESHHRYTQEDVDLAMELGRRAGIAVDNARLFEEAQDELRRRADAETEVRRLNRDLEQMVERRTLQLRQAVDDLEGFCYSVSHDLRAPMRAISGNARIIVEDFADKLDPAGRNSLERIAAAANRMGQLIDDLLQFARLGRSALHRQEVDISAMAEAIASGLQAESIRPVEVRIEPGMRANADAEMLRMALTNLIENAWKYSSRTEKPRIELGRKGSAGENAFYVRDNGIGFDMKYVDKIFQPFERLHRDSEFPGTGIGLANVQRVVSRHGGRVWAEAEPGKGATFSFTLPEEAPADVVSEPRSML